MPLLMRRRPLLRAAAVGGGAYVMGKRHAENQEREATQDQRMDQLEGQQGAGAPTGGMSSDSMERLQELAKLHEQGVLTDAEFAQQKQRLLA